MAGLTFVLMRWLEHTVWSVSDARWYIPVAILVGGLLITALRRRAGRSDLEQQVREGADPTTLHRRRTAYLGASAAIAVGFGGAIGPEAGLIAVVSELSALVSRRVARDHTEAVAIGEAGTAAALGGLYGSPPGAAAYDDSLLTPPKAVNLLAAIAGLGGFLLVRSVRRATRAIDTRATDTRATDTRARRDRASSTRGALRRVPQGPSRRSGDRPDVSASRISASRRSGPGP